MGRFITVIIGKKTDVFGNRQQPNVVAGKPTDTLRLVDYARSLLARLDGRSVARVASWRHAMRALAGMTRLPEPAGSGISRTCRHERLSRPRSGMRLGTF